MSECLRSDAMVTIGAALDWDVPDGVQHLVDCEECRAQLETLCLTRTGLSATEPVAAETLLRITEAVREHAQSERKGRRVQEQRLHLLEAILAGVTAVIVLASSGIRIDNVLTGGLGFLLGSALLMGGRMLMQQAKRSAVL